MILQCRALLVASLMAVSLHADQTKGKPSITLRATPAVAFAPARIVATAEVVGGPDDYQDFYCAKIEWDWGDATTSEAQDDCDPYVAGQSQIRRRYANEHKFELAGNYDVRFTLKQGKKSVGSGVINVRIRDGNK
jgi:hypothetical protein